MAADERPHSPPPPSDEGTTPAPDRLCPVLNRARRLLRQQAPVAVVLAELRTLSGQWTAWEAQGLIHETLLADPLQDSFPLAADYRARFVRQLTRALEEEGAEEVAEPILRELNALLLGSGNTPAPDSYVAYECPVVMVGEEGEGEGAATLVCRVAPRENQVGLKLWEACFVLADHLLAREPQLCKGRHVVELGAGVGLLGLIAARCLGAAEVTLTDADLEVLRFLRHNVQANEGLLGGARVGVAALDWGEPGEYRELLLGGSGSSAKVIMAADCIYDREAIPAFVSVLAWAIRADAGTVVLVASTLRNPETYALFEAEVVGQGLVMEELSKPAIEDGNAAFARWVVEGTGWYESPFYCPNRGAVRLCRIRLKEDGH